MKRGILQPGLQLRAVKNLSRQAQHAACIAPRVRASGERESSANQSWRGGGEGGDGEEGERKKKKENFPGSFPYKTSLIEWVFLVLFLFLALFFCLFVFFFSLHASWRGLLYLFVSDFGCAC